jgi:holliday junction DNA helicase RuvA
MIASIYGILIYNVAPRIIIDVQGIGYEIDVPMSTAYQLPEIGQMLRLNTHLLIKEDAHALYGFYSINEKHMFKELIRISGVGARTALAILSGLSVDDIIQTVQSNRLSLLATIPGIGKKTAERLLLELNNRIHILQTYVHDESCININNSQTIDLLNINDASPSFNQKNSFVQDTLNALIALGYSEKEALKVVKIIQKDESQQTNKLPNLNAYIKKALYILSGKN